MTAVAHTPLRLASLKLMRRAGEGIAVGIPAEWAIRIDDISATRVRLRAVRPYTDHIVHMRLGAGECMPLDDGLRISVKSIRPPKDGKPARTTLRVHADRDVPVYRHEIYDDIIRQMAAEGAQ